jgi:hypothetical protein|tara:strand:+ start:5990 stop:6373 length:384 start_codon:yes stop_codon:yes gene_type:complete
MDFDKLELIFNTKDVEQNITTKTFFDKDNTLLNKGVVKEFLTITDDIVTVTKEFSSNDKSVNHIEITNLPKELYEAYKNLICNKTKILDKLDVLNISLKEHKAMMNNARCDEINIEINQYEALLNIL